MKKIILLVSVLLLTVSAVFATEAITSTRPITVELGANQSALIRCMATVVDEIIVMPIDDRETAVTCRTYVSAEEATGGYRVYTALLTQEATDPPTAVVLQNNTQRTFTYSWISPGRYRLDIDPYPDPEQVWHDTSSPLGSNSQVFVNEGWIEIWTWNGDLLEDILLANSPLEIRIYP